MPAPISIIQSPTFALSRNPIWYRLKTTNYRLTTGVVAIYDLGISAGLSPGATFDLIINQKRYTFVLAATPDGAGYQFRSYTLSADFNLMVADFEANYYLSKYFTLLGSFASNKITLTAKNVGAEYNITMENASGGFSLTTVQTGTSDTFRPNFKAFIDIHHQTDFAASPVSNLITQLDADAHKDSITGTLAANEYVFDFELQEIIHSLLTPYVPAASETLNKLASGLITSFWIRFGEIHGTQTLVNYSEPLGSASNYPQILLGGWKLDDDYSTLITAIKDTTFLNQQPRTKITSKTNHEYLFKYLTSAHTNLQLKYKIYYTDGTTATGLAGTALASSLAANIYVFPSGWNTLNLDAVQPTKTPLKYEMYITNNTSAVLSETQTYILDHNIYEESAEFLFLGIAGAMETVWCHGYKTTQLQSTSDTYQLAKMPWYTKGTNILKHTNEKQNTKTIYSTGYKTLEYITWLKTLAQSSTLYILDGATWASVRLIKDSIKELPTTLDNQYHLTFEVERIEHY